MARTGLSRRAGWVLGAWAALVPAPLVSAQPLREFDASRPRHSEERLSVRMEFPAGDLRVEAGGPGMLFRFAGRYDATRFEPVTAYAAGLLTLGLRRRSGLRLPVGARPAQTARIHLSPEVDWVFDLGLGASESIVDLGGLRVGGGRIQMDGGRVELRFARPAGGHCPLVEIRVNAGELVVDRFGNSGCRRLQVDGGVGRVSLDLGGDAVVDLQATVAMTLGELTVTLPRSAGVRLTVDRFLARFTPEGLVREGNAWVSPGFRTAPRKIDLSVTSALGRVAVRWEG